MSRQQPNPKGRLDVLAVRVIERLARQLEQRHPELSGIWDAAEPHVSKLARQHLGPRRRRR